MDNVYSKKSLELAFEKYQLLKKDPDYLMVYLLLLSVGETHSLHKLMYGHDEQMSYEVEKETLEARKLITQKYNLVHLISPNLKLRKGDLYKSKINPNSSLALLIFAFGIDDNPRLLLPKDYSKRRIKKKVSELTVKEIKFLCYILNTTKGGMKKKSFRAIGRYFSKDHKTIGEWIKEVENWTVTEKQTVANEIITSRRFPNIDITSTSKRRVSYSTLLRKLTKDGFYDTGQKRTYDYLSEPSDD